MQERLDAVHAATVADLNKLPPAVTGNAIAHLIKARLVTC